jgi:hypothetical protein
MKVDSINEARVIFDNVLKHGVKSEVLVELGKI